MNLKIEFFKYKLKNYIYNVKRNTKRRVVDVEFNISNLFELLRINHQILPKQQQR
jgi:mRNA-degrading endonuclease HigB of HigAB toxin-antitoxin module